MQRRTFHGVHFVRLTGNYLNRARTHAKLLKQEILTGAIPILARKNEALIRRGPGLVEIKPIQNAIVRAYYMGFLPLMDCFLDEKYRMMCRVTSEELGVPYEKIRSAFFQADALMFLSRVSVTKQLFDDNLLAALPGCTSGVVMKEWTKAGRLLHARNFDYPVIGAWEKQPTVLFHEPSEKDEIPHISVTSAGVHTSGITSMNREGISMGVHAHFGTEISLSGKPIFYVGDQIISKAKTIGQAVDIAKKIKRAANWAIVLASAKENDAVVIEMTPTKTRVRSADDGIISHSNYFHNKELHRTEGVISGAFCDDLVARICGITDALKQRRGQVEPLHAVQALGSHIDQESKVERVFGNSVSAITTVKSVVFEPESQTFWISNRTTSPVGLGDFVKVNVDSFWDAQKSEIFEPELLPGWKPKNDNFYQGVKHYHEAYRYWHIEAGSGVQAELKALESIRNATAAYPDDGNLWLQKGLVAFKLNHFKEAEDSFKEARTRVLTLHSTQIADLFLARCEDLKGNRPQALEIYKNHVGIRDKALRKAYIQGSKSPYKASRTKQLLLNLQFAGPLHY